MVISILTLLGFLLPFLLDQVKRWQGARDTSEADTYANNAQKFDQALGSRDAGTMSIMFDGLSAPPEDVGGNPGGQDHQKPA